MTNQNNAAQAAKPQTVLSFDERERILCQFIREPINHDREMAIAIETAVLSKLRAPVADERAAQEYGSPADVAQRIEQYLAQDGRMNSGTQLLYEAMKALRASQGDRNDG